MNQETANVFKNKRNRSGNKRNSYWPTWDKTCTFQNSD